MVFKNVRDLREDNDLKQREVAAYLGVSQNTYSQYENGIIAFTDQVLIKLADFYGVSIDYLTDRTDEKKPYPKKKY
ncbi:MAG: helix-turn-helix domain-containing protein [Acutalibacteraceae bacterium]